MASKTFVGNEDILEVILEVCPSSFKLCFNLRKSTKNVEDKKDHLQEAKKDKSTDPEKSVSNVRTSTETSVTRKKFKAKKKSFNKNHVLLHDSDLDRC